MSLKVKYNNGKRIRTCTQITTVNFLLIRVSIIILSCFIYSSFPKYILPRVLREDAKEGRALIFPWLIPGSGVPPAYPFPNPPGRRRWVKPPCCCSLSRDKMAGALNVKRLGNSRFPAAPRVRKQRKFSSRRRRGRAAKFPPPRRENGGVFGDAMPRGLYSQRREKEREKESRGESNRRGISLIEPSFLHA